MDKRTFQRLSTWEQRRVVEQAAEEINRQLNLFGQETVDELLDAALAGEAAATRYVDRLLAETDDPSFPPDFLAAARPACDTYLRYARYWREV